MLFKLNHRSVLAIAIAAVVGFTASTASIADTTLIVALKFVFSQPAN